MPDRLSAVIADLQMDPDLGTLVEAEVSSCVRRVFNALGWEADNLNEVKPEYSVGTRRVDYALLTGGAPQVFVEVKRGVEQLDRHQEQLLDYAFKEGIRLAILTNGTMWWLYLPLQPGNWEGRRFAAFNLNEQNKAEIVRVLAAVLSKENVGDGSAFGNAERLYQQTQRRSRISETMPKAWNQLIDDFDGLIVARIAEMTGELCGHQPDEAEVEAFLSTHLHNLRILPKVLSPKPDKVVIRDKNQNKNQTWMGKRITAFTFNGVTYPVERWWTQFLAKFFEILSQDYIDQFEDVLELNPTFFSRNPKQDFPPTATPFHQPIGETGIYFRTDVDNNQKMRIVEELVKHFGCEMPVLHTDEAG